MNEWQFNRHITYKLINSLKATVLWKNKLEADCRAGKVFLAIRDGYISFYHRGGGLFTFDKNGFKTHVKYALVINTESSKAKTKKEGDTEDKKTKDKESEITYIYQDQIKDIIVFQDFISAYDGIKKNCALYSENEAEGVSNLYKNSSYLPNKPIFVLDTEIAFRRIYDSKHSGQDRIDILLYNSNTKTLRFIEAKHFTNKEIWSKSTPRVAEQIKRYEEQIKKHEKEIIEGYCNYIDGLNVIFNKQFVHPKTVDPKVSLLIFGFDGTQKEGDQFKELVLKKLSDEKINVYSIGDPKYMKAENIWRETNTP